MHIFCAFVYIISYFNMSGFTELQYLVSVSKILTVHKTLSWLLIRMLNRLRRRLRLSNEMKHGELC
jgi:amino acid permease